MTYFTAVFKTELMLRFRNRANKFLCFLAVFLLFLVFAFVKIPSAASIRVGVCLPDRDGEQILAMLQDDDTQIVEYISADEKTIDSKVLSGEWDCGLLFSEDFAERLAKMDLKKLVTIKIGPASTVYPIVQEAVSSGIMEWISPYMADAYLNRLEISDAPVIEVYSKWQQEEQWVQVSMQTANGQSLQPVKVVKSVKQHIISGLAAVFTLVWGLYLTVDLGKWLQSSAAIRFSAIRPVTQLLLPKLTAGLLPVYIWGLGLLCVMSCDLMQWAAFSVFVLLIMAIGLIIPRFPGLWQSVIALIPFLVIGSLLLEPVLLDVSFLFPELTAFTGWLPVSLCLGAYSGDLASFGMMMAECAILLVLSFALDRKK